ncbi:MAG: nitrile hydratase subunit alpha [Sulfuritalea sp.]|jgi:nitrile hydratase|nr:nitrile hydratase subunit alpha [Polynucleobacter sp.]MCF8187619.1 nitrile hydratase subunit alpha [Sulfuritalea sp.]
MNAKPHAIASIEQRLDSIQTVLEQHGMEPDKFIDTFHDLANEHWIPENGARLVARAWSDPEFKQRLLGDGTAAIQEMGLSMPPHHRHFVVLENTADIHNVICCTLCSCTAFTIIGLPPDWYKDLEYRARVVRESRTVLQEMGLDLPAHVQIRVWDTTADTRYMVLPQRPTGTENLNAEQLAALVNKDALIGVARL